MNYAAIKNCDIANGPGVRVSLFVSGCRHHCKDCFNPETWDFACGEPFDEAVMDKLLALLAPGYIRGITYLGGEPFEPENQPGLLELSRRIRAAYPEKSIWSFTGYLFDRDILAKKLGPWEVTQELLSYLDVLVERLDLMVREALLPRGAAGTLDRERVRRAGVHQKELPRDGGLGRESHVAGSIRDDSLLR